MSKKYSFFVAIKIFIFSFVILGIIFDFSPVYAKKKEKTSSKRTSPASLSPLQRRQLFNRANKFYNDGQYQKALQLFLKLYEPRRWENFKVLYNIGNCYYRLQRYGEALAFYRKAQRLHPNEVNLLHNLQLIQQRTHATIEAFPYAKAKFFFWYYLLNLRQLFWLLIFITAMTLLLWAIHISRSHRGESGLKWVVAVLVTLTLVVWGSFFAKYYNERTRHSGVITAQKVTARSGYGENYEALFILNQADTVLIKERVGQWFRIEIVRKDKNSKKVTTFSGWVPARTVMPI